MTNERLKSGQATLAFPDFSVDLKKRPEETSKKFRFPEEVRDRYLKWSLKNKTRAESRIERYEDKISQKIREIENERGVISSREKQKFALKYLTELKGTKPAIADFLKKYLQEEGFLMDWHEEVKKRAEDFFDNKIKEGTGMKSVETIPQDMTGKGLPSDEEIKKIIASLDSKLFATHGTPFVDRETAEVGLKKESDLDGKMSVWLAQKYGRERRGKAEAPVSHVYPGEKVEGGTTFDSGGEDGFVSKLTKNADGGESESYIYDHHSPGASNDYSAAKHVYEKLKKAGLIGPADEKYLDAAIDFLTLCDNGELKIPKNFFEKGNETLLGLWKYISPENLVKFFRAGKNPKDILNEEELSEYGLLKKAKEVEQLLKYSKLELKKLEAPDSGLIVNSSKYGKIAIDIGKKIPVGWEACRAFGINTYIIWNPDVSRFIIYSDHELGFDLPQGKKVRKRIYVKPPSPTYSLEEKRLEKFSQRGELKESNSGKLEFNLRDILEKMGISADGLAKIDNELGAFLVQEKAKKDEKWEDYFENKFKFILKKYHERPLEKRIELVVLRSEIAESKSGGKIGDVEEKINSEINSLKQIVSSQVEKLLVAAFTNIWVNVNEKASKFQGTTREEEINKIWLPEVISGMKSKLLEFWHNNHRLTKYLLAEDMETAIEEAIKEAKEKAANTIKKQKELIEKKLAEREGVVESARKEIAGKTLEFNPDDFRENDAGFKAKTFGLPYSALDRMFWGSFRGRVGISKEIILRNLLENRQTRITFDKDGKEIERIDYFDGNEWKPAETLKSAAEVQEEPKQTASVRGLSPENADVTSSSGRQKESFTEAPAATETDPTLDAKVIDAEFEQASEDRQLERMEKTLKEARESYIEIESMAIQRLTWIKRVLRITKNVDELDHIKEAKDKYLKELNALIDFKVGKIKNDKSFNEGEKKSRIGRVGQDPLKPPGYYYEINELYNLRTFYRNKVQEDKRKEKEEKREKIFFERSYDIIIAHGVYDIFLRSGLSSDVLKDLGVDKKDWKRGSAEIQKNTEKRDEKETGISEEKSKQKIIIVGTKDFYLSGALAKKCGLSELDWEKMLDEYRKEKGFFSNEPVYKKGSKIIFTPDNSRIMSIIDSEIKAEKETGVKDDTLIIKEGEDIRSTLVRSGLDESRANEMIRQYLKEKNISLAEMINGLFPGRRIILSADGLKIETILHTFYSQAAFLIKDISGGDKRNWDKLKNKKLKELSSEDASNLEKLTKKYGIDGITRGGDEEAIKDWVREYATKILEKNQTKPKLNE